MFKLYIKITICLVIALIGSFIYLNNKTEQVSRGEVEFNNVQPVGAVVDVGNCNEEVTLSEQIACLAPEFAPTPTEVSFEDALLGLAGKDNLGASAESILLAMPPLGENSRAKFLYRIWEKKLRACSAIKESGCNIEFNGQTICPDFDFSNLDLTQYADILSQANAQITAVIDSQLSGIKEPVVTEVSPTVRPNEPTKPNYLFIILGIGLMIIVIITFNIIKYDNKLKK